ncbi:thiosulfate sulfurtransferase (plasmid) [Mycetohabitans rhizoxinica]|uniref:Thiosulfate sulfurtransferase n=2 Tax=Mycetohabitans rhizoxinica TaxID=412963 RepID=E5ATY0_MYCRK|nr:MULTISPECIES: thiosulfate sulfurtransferase [unclassified Mycetohabitans]MCF7697220.1 thiosulfate sulfurtransferase [Mycetohabitans sp. B2]MCG1048609.1 thiosulfate sulfurtransferase [Mycetohabitans sp. B6]CBW76554.1 Thiosulfate sulfurtransferase (EC 2.8.1.1) [Mycetohabitans rhizoxinica HKI 454]
MQINALAPYAAPEVAALTGKPASVLTGGTAAWNDAGLAIETGKVRTASPRIDRYRCSDQGTNNLHSTTHAHLDWEYALVAQLERDGTHSFFVI